MAIQGNVETVTIVCRLPAGLILDLYDEKVLKDRAEAAKPGPTYVPIMTAPEPKATIRLRGAKHDPRYHPRSNVLLGMGGRTAVPKDFWEAWCKQNPNFGPLKNNLIFAEKTERDAVAMLAELRDERTGFEGCEKDKLPGVKPFAADDDE